MLSLCLGWGEGTENLLFVGPRQEVYTRRWTLIGAREEMGTGNGRVTTYD